MGLWGWRGCREPWCESDGGVVRTIRAIERNERERERERERKRVEDKRRERERNKGFLSFSFFSCWCCFFSVLVVLLVELLA